MAKNLTFHVPIPEQHSAEIQLMAALDYLVTELVSDDAIRRRAIAWLAAKYAAPGEPT